MTLLRHASTHARAVHHFGTLIAGLNGAAAALVEVERDMRDLPKEYRAQIGACDLVMYVQPSPAGRPQAVHWARMFRHQAADGTVHRWRRHLPGKLTHRKIYLIARRYPERAKFFAFDRRRVAMNRRHASLARRLDGLRKAILCARIPEQRRPPVPPPVRTLEERVGGGDALMTSAWALAWALAATQVAMLRYAEEARASLPALKLFPYATTNYEHVTVGWAEREKYVRDAKLRVGRRHVASRMTNGLLQAFGVPRGFWSALHAIDGEMRRLRELHGRHATAVGRAKRLRNRTSDVDRMVRTSYHRTTLGDR